MISPRDNVGVLLMRCGTYLVGVDPASVRSIRPAEERDQLLLDLGVFLQSVRADAPADAESRPRVVELESAGGQSLRVDHAFGTRTYRLAEVVPLGPVLEKHGAPSWWLGTAEHEGEMVLLVDLAALANAAETPQ